MISSFSLTLAIIQQASQHHILYQLHGPYGLLCDTKHVFALSMIGPIQLAVGYPQICCSSSRFGEFRSVALAGLSLCSESEGCLYDYFRGC